VAKASRRFRRAARRRALRGLPRGRVLKALTSSTLALPGLASHADELGSLGIEADYKYARYSEDRIPSSKVTPGGERDRYTIDVNQVHLSGPITERFKLDLDVGYEVMSGATPWYVVPNPSGGQPLQVMTGATIDEKRTDGSLKGTMLFDRGSAALSGGVSVENDYLAFTGGLDGERYFNEKNTTLSGGLGFSIDRIEPTDAEAFGRNSEEDKQTVSGFLGLSQVLGRETIVQATLQYQFDNGFLSDPYKRALVEGVPVPDARPDMRHQISLLTRFRHHFETLRATLHADYRFYVDDWGINAHTFEVAWYQTLWESLRLIPSFRYYTQSAADFYAPYYEGPRGDNHYSSDYRLSPYGAISWRIKAETRFQIWSLDWIANVGYEQYMSGGNYAIRGVSVENPGLVGFDMLSAGLTLRF
jgi:hypothetical protein